MFFFFEQKTAYEMRISDWSSDVCSSDLLPVRKAIGTEVDPVMLEIFNNLFMSIAEQMGSVLEKTAYSVNIKERLDFSCAIFDLDGELIANAPHMPEIGRASWRERVCQYV